MELTEAMGINRPSMYAAFGNKEELFRRALERYVNGPAGYVRKALAKRTAREVVECLLTGAIELLSDSRNPHGCLMVQGALACGAATEPIRRELIAHRAAGFELIRDRLETAKETATSPRRA
jgi:AcrR family transcriptional regulator